MSKLNFHVGRTVHFAHGYRNVGGREVWGKRVLEFSLAPINELHSIFFLDRVSDH